MSIFSNTNNNDDENNDKPSSSIRGSTSYPSSTKNNKGKSVIILGVGAIAVVITTVIYYQQISLDREANEYIDFILATWEATNGEKGYNIIKDIVQTSEFKDKVKTAFSESKTEVDRKSKLYKVLMSVMPEYLERLAIEDPSLSNIARGLIFSMANQMRLAQQQ